MPTLNKYALRSILTHLDEASRAITERDARDYPGMNVESHAAWKIRMARERLYEAVIASVEVEPLAEAA